MNAKTVLFAAPKDDTDFVNLMQREKSTRPVSHKLSNNAANINLSTTRTALLLSPLALAACGGSEGEDVGDSSSIVPPASGGGGENELTNDGGSDLITSKRLDFQEIDISNITNFTLPLIAPVDFNLDGAIDFLVTHGEFPRGNEPFPPERDFSFVPFLLVNKDGILMRQEIVGDPPKLTHPRDFLVTDFNNDGFPDVIIVGHGWDAPPFPGEKNVLLYGGADGFTDKSYLLPDNNDFTHSVAAGDLTGNGFPDIYVGDLDGPYLILNIDGNNFEKVKLDPIYFFDPSAPSRNGVYTSSLITKLSDDGGNVLIVGSDLGSETRIFTFDSNLATTNLISTLPSGLFDNTIVLDIDVGDLNGDGLNDIVLLQTNDYVGAGIQILIQDSEGNFVDETKDRMPDFDLSQPWITFMYLVDLDRDNSLDIVVTQPPKNGSIAYLNKNGVFVSIDLDYSTEFFDTLVDIKSGDVFASWGSNGTLFFEQLVLV